MAKATAARSKKTQDRTTYQDRRLAAARLAAAEAVDALTSANSPEAPNLERLAFAAYRAHIALAELWTVASAAGRCEGTRA